MRAIRIHQFGGPDVVQWEEIPKPVVQPSQVLIRIKATSINHLDIWVRKGISHASLPMILGSDGAGIVAEVGEGVTAWQPGDEVVIQPLTYCGQCRFCRHGQENYCDSFGIFGENQDGTQCEYMVLDEKYLFSKPTGFSFEETAAFPLVSETAYAMLVQRAHIEADETILIWGAGSGVGSMAIQIAKVKGCKVIAVAGSQEKLDLAVKLGADVVINHQEENVISRIKDATGEWGVDVVFEHVGAATWTTSLKALAKGGRLVTCGATTGPKVELNLNHLFFKQHSILGSTMGNVDAFKEVLALIDSKLIMPVVDTVFPFEDVRQAHQYLEQGQHFGKVILVP